MATITTALSAPWPYASVTAYLAGGTSQATTIAPPAPKVTNVGTAGAIQHQYEIVSIPSGAGHTNILESVPSAAGQTTTGNATLNSTNYNQVTWTPVVGAAAYRILRQTGGAGGYTHIGTVAGSVTTYNDQSSSAGAAYTAISSSGVAQSAFSVSGSTFAYPTGTVGGKAQADGSGNVTITTTNAGLHWLVIETQDGLVYLSSAIAA